MTPATAADRCPSCGQPHTDDEVCRPEGAPDVEPAPDTSWAKTVEIKDYGKQPTTAAQRRWWWLADAYVVLLVVSLLALIAGGAAARSATDIPAIITYVSGGVLLVLLAPVWLLSRD